MINRLLKKLIFHFFKILLIPLDGRFPRIYMKMYNSLLEMMGVKMDGHPRYISTQVRFDDFERIHLSERVVISEKVILLTHDYSLTTGIMVVRIGKKTMRLHKKPTPSSTQLLWLTNGTHQF